ncbi:efflux RND transporter periplasmic adaptor subunit [Halobacteriovorax sp. HLS]|uniref:efflux RND transporter periplasmic adaptor subunit n=1 Tax=Halobacteriovorax sp. HLS TaxID=2234000 RepID=UPI000FDB0BAC|nr:efflux RND transporter periplasmic adaptor subunit [Halobacteriovorax sp. HLS]
MNKYIHLTILLLSLISFSCSKDSSTSVEIDKSAKSEIYYTCSMHPQVKEKGPGKCPICHMNLTKVEVEQGEHDHQKEVVLKKLYRCANFPDVTSEVAGVCPIDGTEMIAEDMAPMVEDIIAKVKLRKAQMNHFFPDFFPVTPMKMNKKIRVLGSVLQSEEKESSIPARVGGRVEEVFVKSTGSLVRKGDPVLVLYSPKLITAGEEYLLAKKSFKKNKSKDFKEMLKQSEERLLQWGLKSSQFEKWAQTNTVPREITIYSNATGIVRKRNAFVGKYFKEGQNFFELSDLADVWVEMDVYEQDSALVHNGQKVDLSFNALPGETVSGVIDFVSPVLDDKSRTLKIRSTIKNEAGNLKPGMIADAVLNIEVKGLPLVIPRTAVIDTGKRKVVWVKTSKSSFVAKVIRTGYESEGYVEVKHGLMEGEEVVIEGNFLLDAQAQLFGGYEDPIRDSGTSPKSN